MVNVPQRYVPRNLTKKDKKRKKKQLLKSRKNYKKGKYHTRKKVKSFKSKVSPHIKKARKMYKVNNIKPTAKLAKKTKCSIKGLRRMVQKGQGAYYSSGSRPNQTGHSWGYARMASAITGGKASAVDFHILKEECKKNSKALRLAKKSISVNCVAFGGVEGRENKAFMKRYSELCPSGRMLTEDEIFNPIEFLISNKTSGITGHILMVDGGWTVW